MQFQSAGAGSTAESPRDMYASGSDRIWPDHEGPTELSSWYIRIGTRIECFAALPNPPSSQGARSLEVYRNTYSGGQNFENGQVCGKSRLGNQNEVALTKEVYFLSPVEPRPVR